MPCFFTPATPKGIILSLYRARLLAPIVPEAAEIVRRLSARADLPRVPQIYQVPSAVPNAFAVGDRADSAIAVTDGMLRLLDVRELAGVLAHEVSHIANRELWRMSLADAMARLTMLMAYAGRFLLLVNLPPGARWRRGGALDRSCRPDPLPQR